MKWEYKVLPLKTKVRVDHFATEGKPVMESIQEVKHFRERRMGLGKRSKYSPRRW